MLAAQANAVLILLISTVAITLATSCKTIQSSSGVLDTATDVTIECRSPAHDSANHFFKISFDGHARTGSAARVLQQSFEMPAATYTASYDYLGLEGRFGPDQYTFTGLSAGDALSVRILLTDDFGGTASYTSSDQTYELNCETQNYAPSSSGGADRPAPVTIDCHSPTSDSANHLFQLSFARHPRSESSAQVLQQSFELPAATYSATYRYLALEGVAGPDQFTFANLSGGDQLVVQIFLAGDFSGSATYRKNGTTYELNCETENYESSFVGSGDDDDEGEDRQDAPTTITCRSPSQDTANHIFRLSFAGHPRRATSAQIQQRSFELPVETYRANYSYLGLESTIGPDQYTFEGLAGGDQLVVEIYLTGSYEGSATYVSSRQSYDLDCQSENY